MCTGSSCPVDSADLFGAATFMRGTLRGSRGKRSVSVLSVLVGDTLIEVPSKERDNIVGKEMQQTTDVGCVDRIPDTLIQHQVYAHTHSPSRVPRT